MTDDLVERAQKHIARDHERDEKLDAAQRFAEKLGEDTDPIRREVGKEFIAIVGEPA
ncbi:hypothetical protein [Nocardia sp. NBC_01327]|uniref:hypothetical protein n=1 Tax=Nocardia sp. NBC_01327 TaxID=2903593 RepID=UPI002E10B3EA|nr:hypothetical protein OG326_24020 [Nocardia sp. NBC_01327]